ncbi:MAG: CDP-alcohol phosphatidyltransferase family protein [Elusimicrobia bacterium]|nr:CDP-alcohol phosphatidyltransferase family protein [Elusimicrobiota bacterium]
MTLANRITLARMGLSLAIFGFIITHSLWAEFVALLLLTVASISDGVDGAIARRTGTTTPFGAIADPFADKLLIMSVFLGFASLKELNIPIWAVFLILLRELTISTLRVLAALNGVALKAERAGKIKTTIQLTSSFIILVLLILGMWSKAQVLPGPLEYLGSLAGQAGWWLTVITAFFTVVSGAIYLTNHRDLISRSWNEKGQ